MERNVDPIDYAPPQHAAARIRRRLHYWLPLMVGGVTLFFALALLPTHRLTYMKARFGWGTLSADEVRSLRDSLTTDRLGTLLRTRPVLALELVELRQFQNADMLEVAHAARELGASGAGPVAADRLRWWLSRRPALESERAEPHVIVREAIKDMFTSAPQHDKRAICLSFLRVEGLDFRDSPALLKLESPDTDIERLFFDEYQRTESRYDRR